MTDLRIARIDEYPDPSQYPDILFKIPKEKREAIGKLKHEKARRQSASAWLLLSDILSEKEIELSKMQVIFTKQGKPEINGIGFSLSHSGDYVLCALSETTVGADIQVMNERTSERIERIAQRFFTDAEIGALETAKENKLEYEKLFYTIFCCKEAFIKCTGEGLARDLRSFTVPIVYGKNTTEIDGITYRFEVIYYDGRYGNNGEKSKDKECDTCTKFEEKEVKKAIREIRRREESEKEDIVREENVEDSYCGACCYPLLHIDVLSDGEDIK